MIFIPLLIGQAFAFAAHGQFSGLTFLVALLFGVLFQVYLLYRNDIADEAVDRTNDRYFLSGGSRVLPEGKLERTDLLKGSRVVLFGLTVLVLGVAGVLDRPAFPLGAVLAVVLCWAYNSKPMRLSYRGHGEVLQGLGCGVLLPLIGFYLQQGSLEGFPWGALVPLYLIFHAGNIVTALPDAPSDRAGGKRTFPVRWGERQAQRTVLGLLTAAYVAVLFVAPPLTAWASFLVVAPAVLVLLGVARGGARSATDATDFPACKRFVIGVSASQAWLLCAWISALFLAGSR